MREGKGEREMESSAPPETEAWAASLINEITKYITYLVDKIIHSITWLQPTKLPVSIEERLYINTVRRGNRELNYNSDVCYLKAHEF